MIPCSTHSTGSVFYFILSLAEVQDTIRFFSLQPRIHKRIRDSAMESEPTDGKDVQAEASAPISESQTEALDTEAELSKLTPELQAKFKQLLAQETKHLSERTDSTGSVKEPPPKQQKVEVDDDFQAFLSFLPEIDLEWGDLDPNVQQKLRYSQQAREDFKALHHQKQEINTYDPETRHIATTQPKKRAF